MKERKKKYHFSLPSKWWWYISKMSLQYLKKIGIKKSEDLWLTICLSGVMQFIHGRL